MLRDSSGIFFSEEAGSLRLLIQEQIFLRLFGQRPKRAAWPVSVSILHTGRILAVPRLAFVPATPMSKQQGGVGSVNFRTVDLRSALFNWSYCVPCVPSDALVCGCMMFLFCIQEADWGMMAFAAYLAPWLSE